MEPFFEHYKEIIPDFSDFQESLQKPLPGHIRVNRLKAESGALVRTLNEKGIHLKKAMDGDKTLFFAPNLVHPGNLIEYFLGYIHPQALTSCLVSLILSPKGHSSIIDLCASPGGKTSHLAQLMNNTGLIIANEPYPTRQVALGNALNRLGVLNTIVTAYQAQEFPLKHQRFDYVLADVPCSGEGIFRSINRHSGYQGRVTKEGLTSLQKRIIKRGFDLLKGDGQMVYATCTYDPEENESVVNHPLKRRDADLFPIDMDLGHEPGLSEWKGERYDNRLRRTIRFYPHRVDSVGFFVARIGRR